MKKIYYLKPTVRIANIEVGNLLENVSFNPDEEGELDSKKSSSFSSSKKNKWFDDDSDELY